MKAFKVIRVYVEIMRIRIRIAILRVYSKSSLTNEIPVFTHLTNQKPHPYLWIQSPSWWKILEIPLGVRPGYVGDGKGGYRAIAHAEH